MASWWVYSCVCTGVRVWAALKEPPIRSCINQNANSFLFFTIPWLCYQHVSLTLATFRVGMYVVYLLRIARRSVINIQATSGYTCIRPTERRRGIARRRATSIFTSYTLYLRIHSYKYTFKCFWRFYVKLWFSS